MSGAPWHKSGTKRYLGEIEQMQALLETLREEEAPLTSRARVVREIERMEKKMRGER